jgi:hypothetical protein
VFHQTESIGVKISIGSKWPKFQGRLEVLLGVDGNVLRWRGLWQPKDRPITSLLEECAIW